jgi:hypothetical protein
MVVAAAALLGGSRANAQSLPSEPFTFAGGRVVLGGDVAASIAPEDTGFFNYSDYEHSTLREVRVGLAASVRASERLSFLGEIRSENFGEIQPFAAYARVKPWRDRRLDIQAGRIPPTFGAFTRRAYGNQNPLIGFPLAYQYLTSLRADATPRDAEELARMRGRGWLSAFGVGSTTPARGLPLVTAFSWDTGVQVSTGWRRLDVTASVTNGSASNPRLRDDNDGKQLAARASVQASAALRVGGSFTRGKFLQDALAGASSDGIQRAFGLDAEYARSRWVARADAVLSDWTVPVLGAPVVENPLRAWAFSAEGRYTIVPGLYAAARAEHLGFSRVSTLRERVTWEAPVTRIEVGGGYYLQRNLVARVSLQINRRDGGRVTRSTLPAAQLLYWF